MRKYISGVYLKSISIFIRVLFVSILILSFDSVKIIFNNEELILLGLYGALIYFLTDKMINTYEKSQEKSVNIDGDSNSSEYISYGIIVVTSLFWMLGLFYFHNFRGGLLSVVMGLISFLFTRYFYMKVNTEDNGFNL